MFASQRVPRSYNHYMLSTPDIKRGACAGFEQARSGTRPPRPSGEGDPSECPALFCGLCPSAHGGCASPLFTVIVTIQRIFKKFSLFFCHKFVVKNARKSARGFVSFRL